MSFNNIDAFSKDERDLKEAYDYKQIKRDEKSNLRD